MAATDAQGGALDDDDRYDEETGEILPPPGLDDDPGSADWEEISPEPHPEPAAEMPRELSIDTLSGDIRDALLSRFRMAKRPWEAMGEEERSDLVEGLSMAARSLVRDAVRLVTSYDFPRAVATLGDVKIIAGEKARIEAKITCPNISEYREVLGEAAGDHIMVLMVDSETFMNARAPVPIEPDQAELPLGGEG